MLCLFRVLLDACPFCFLQYTALPICCNCSPFLVRVHMGKWPSHVVWWSVPHFSCCWMPSPLQAHWGRWCHTCLLLPACLFTVRVGKCPCPPLVVLSTWPWLLQAFSSPRLLGRGRQSCLLRLACLFTVCVKECPSSTLQSSGHPAVFATCLFFFSTACLLFSFFFFFPWVGVNVSRGLCWFVPGSTMCCLFAHLVVSQTG
jgi:hypothetical protein